MADRPRFRRRCTVALSMLLFAGLAAACGDDAPAGEEVVETPTTTHGATPSSPSSAATEDRSTPWPVPIEDEIDGSWGIEILAEIPHDPTSFTQGLEVDRGRLLESTGRTGESTLREIDLADGEVLASVPLDAELYGEGLTVLGDEVIQLTWRAGRALRWDRASFAPLGEFTYDGEGWGLCAAGDELLMSDGSATLTRRNGSDFAVIDTVEVRRTGEPVELLNELECIDGLVLANVWRSDEIVVIDPDSGRVRVTIDAAELRASVDPGDPAETLNGIADLGDGTLLLGGKNWPRHFVVRLTAGER